MEAIKGVGCDLLLVCGFAFDRTASVESASEARRAAEERARQAPCCWSG